MKSSLRVLSERTRRYLAIMAFLLIVFIIPFVLVGIMPGTSWGKEFWSNIKINDYSFYYSLYWGSVSAVANCELLMIYATLNLSNRLGRDSLKYSEAELIADIMGYEIEWKKKHL